MEKIKVNGKFTMYIFIDESRKNISTPFIYDDVKSFNGLFIAQKDNKWGFLNKAGKEITPFIYDEAYGFKEGLAQVRIDDKWLIVDQFGNHLGADEIENSHFSMKIA